ncbi:hypothetical protein [Pyxidicoccus caerfyrddinensis]|uniref:hypothetical protein n=1 Tax=Pyxidicoccus caerfyrddinensis TaxID=2709663 RepID=UPI0013DA7581|nr:hypothetical protein [Pyxidicoccus caerfyrddinensis]
MWIPLSDPGLVSAYTREFHGGNAPPRFVRLLSELQQLELPATVYAVTSLHNLWLTMATAAEPLGSTDAITIDAKGNLCVVSYFEAGNRRAVAGRLCKESELRDLVEVYLLRMILCSQSYATPVPH